jgi:hypothetical protein
MKKLQDILKGITFIFMIAVLAVSCSTDNENSDLNESQPLSQAELKSILETDEISASVDMVLAEFYGNDDSSAKGSNECYEAAYTDTGFTATFNNCVLNGSENINGTLTVVYEMESQAAAFTATFTDFYVGDIKVNGSRTYNIGAGSAESSIEFTVVSDIELIFADDSIIEEVGTKSLVFQFGETLESSTIAISGSWTIEMDGNTYVVEVTEDLIGNFGCDHLVSGLLYVGKNGLAVTIDFGDGNCDNLATIIYPDDTTEEVTLDN